MCTHDACYICVLTKENQTEQSIKKSKKIPNMHKIILRIKVTVTRNVCIVKILAKK